MPQTGTPNIKRYRTLSILATVVVALGFPIIRHLAPTTGADIEILWTLIAFLGIVFALDTLREALRNDQVRRLQGLNGAFRVITRGKTRTSVSVLTYLLFLFQVGFNTLFLPPRNVRMEPTATTLFFAHLQAVIVPWGFFAMILAIVWNLYADRRDGYLLDAYAFREQNAEITVLKGRITDMEGDRDRQAGDAIRQTDEGVRQTDEAMRQSGVAKQQRETGAEQAVEGDRLRNVQRDMDEHERNGAP